MASRKSSRDWNTAPAGGIAVFARACDARWNDITATSHAAWIQHMARAAS